MSIKKLSNVKGVIYWGGGVVGVGWVPNTPRGQKQSIPFIFFFKKNYLYPHHPPPDRKPVYLTGNKLNLQGGGPI